MEYDRCKEEKSSLQAELNSCKAEIRNEVRTYQQFVDRNLALKKREDELLHSIGELEKNETELQKTITGLKQHISELRENDVNNTTLNLAFPLHLNNKTGNGIEIRHIIFAGDFYYHCL